MLTYENQALIKYMVEAIRPHLEDGQKVIWRAAFRWHDDNGAL